MRRQTPRKVLKNFFLQPILVGDIFFFGKISGVVKFVFIEENEKTRTWQTEKKVSIFVFQPKSLYIMYFRCRVAYT